METTVYLIRHGQTELNTQSRMQGRIDVPLNDRGREQALIAKKTLEEAEIKFTKVYSSPLSRAFETSCIASGFDKADVLTDDRLMEIDFGENEGGSIIDAMNNPEDTIFKRPELYNPSLGESYYDLIKRVGGFIDELKQNIENRTFIDETILIATHGAAARAIETYLCGYDVKYFWKNAINNCAVFRLDLFSEEDKFVEIFEGFVREKKKE